ncbi:MAG: hypothetical protein R2710_25640 [Acidimicrobiales bacterium]
MSERSTYEALGSTSPERRRAVDRSGTTDLAEYTLATTDDPSELAAAQVVIASSSARPATSPRPSSSWSRASSSATLILRSPPSPACDW